MAAKPKNDSKSSRIVGEDVRVAGCLKGTLLLPTPVGQSQDDDGEWYHGEKLADHEGDGKQMCSLKITAVLR